MGGAFKYNWNYEYNCNSCSWSVPGTPHSHIVIETKAFVMHILNCNELSKFRAVGYGHIKVASDMKEEPILLMGSSWKIPIYTLTSQTSYHNLARPRWIESGHTWYTNWYKTEIRQCSKYMTLRQIWENINRHYNNRNIYLLPESQESLKPSFLSDWLKTSLWLSAIPDDIDKI